MKRLLFVLSVCALATSVFLGRPAISFAQPSLDALEEQALKEAAALVSPSIVKIDTVGGLELVGQVLTGTGPTTGLIISADGYIISSSFNFASQPAAILVTLADGRRLPATLVASDKSKMLTLLRIDAKDLPVPQVAPKEEIRVGQTAIALGKTFEDEQPSISVGIISALGRIWGRALQTDAKISPVNYGGPLVDLRGRVMGVLVPLAPDKQGVAAGVEWYDSGIGFAISLTEIFSTLDRLKAGTDLMPGLMGISIKGRNIYEGEPVIDRVRYDSPAHKAGLKEGDAITEIDGQKIVRQAQLQQALGNRYAGDKIAVVVKRGEESLPKEITLTDKLVAWQSAYLGILPLRGKVNASTPATVRLVIPDSPAAAAGIERGDRILKVADQPTADAAELLEAISHHRPGTEVSLVVANEAGAERTVSVKLGTLPDTVLDDLPATANEGRDNSKPAEGAPKVGHFSDQLPGHEQGYWAIVPDDYNPEYRYGLVVWLQPAGDTQEAQMLSLWKSHCARRGIILVAPKMKQISGWTPDESGLVEDLVKSFQTRYSIDNSRIVAHGYDVGGTFAYHVAFKYRSLFRGVSVAASALREPPPDNEAENRLQFYLTVGDNDPMSRVVESNAKGLRDLKFSVVQKTIENHEHKYPPAAAVETMAKWIDSLDRI